MKKNEDAVLVPDGEELPGLKLAYDAYASGQYSDTEVARLLNERGYRSKTGRPFSKETLRDILQNQTYLGKVKYQAYRRNSNGSRSYAAPIEWLEGQHEAVVDEEVFEQCQKVRASRARHYQATKRYNAYLLRDLIYCYRCCSNPPKGQPSAITGKCDPRRRVDDQHRYYRCGRRELGYSCEQAGVNVEIIDEQVVGMLMRLKPPKTGATG